MVYDNGIKRPLVRAPNSAGVQRLITRYFRPDFHQSLTPYNSILRIIFSYLCIIHIYSALEGVCHQLGTYYAFDIGAPTYFRKSIASDGGTGKN